MATPGAVDTDVDGRCRHGGTVVSIEARLAIHEMIARYSYAYDGQDADAFAELFVEDGVFEIFVGGTENAAVRLESRHEIRAWAARRFRERQGRFTSRHHQSGLLFDELSADSARTRTMVLVTHQDLTEAAPRVTDSGVYHDRWRRTPDGWRLAHRAAHVDRTHDVST
jgi:ketosteroid isomerase-like protein